MRCLPFSDHLYRDLQERGLDANSLWSNRERYGRGKRWHHSPEALEDDLRWLITVGVLRREVDGQGLTSRFRLTPLGRALMDRDPDLLHKPVRSGEQLRQALRRRWPL
jgi:DNA-binding HxlR family transcriptional regulator